MPRPPLTLAIEISNPSAAEGNPGAHPGVAIGEGIAGPSARVLDSEPLAQGREHDDDLLPAIDRLTRRLSIGPRDLNRVAVSVGPGGFTSLRLAVAAAKMICEATGARCCAVPTARVAARAFAPAQGSFAVALSAKGDSVFATVFDASGIEQRAGHIVGAEQIRALGAKILLADSYLPEAIRNACRGSLDIVPIPLNARACFAASLSEPDCDALDLAPIYPRPPEAVVKWMALHPERYPAT